MEHLILFVCLFWGALDFICLFWGALDFKSVISIRTVCVKNENICMQFKVRWVASSSVAQPVNAWLL